jgi:hypothetical protein
MSDRDPSGWSSAPASSPVPPMPTRARRSGTGAVVLLTLLVLLLTDTFLPWQRACIDVSGFGVHFAGCVSANAWSATAAHVGQAAGLLCIAAIVMLGLRLGGMELGEGAAPLTRAFVYATVGAAALKWLLVIGKLAAVGAWLGILLCLAIALLETVDSFGAR